METIKPVKPNRTKTTKNDQNDQLTAAEMGKLWATYMGNTMASCVLRYYLQNVDDEDIRGILDEAVQLTERFTKSIDDIFTRGKYPMPIGFTEKDVSLNAPRLFADELYLHYLIYVGKAGISIYGTAIPLMVRSDVREFFTNGLSDSIKLLNKVNELLEIKGYLSKPPYIPVPKHPEFIRKKSYLNGFFGNVRPLQALEITHLHDSVQNNAISRAILTGFTQTASQEPVRQFFVRGKELATKHIESFSKMLHQEDLPSPDLLDHLVTESTVAPFSDRLMVFHKLDMFTMRIRTYGNALSFAARHDLVAIFARCSLEVGNYAEAGADLMIEHGWFEQPPQAADREALVIK
ncbi:DUF3231 family protein [Paenibacillus allorhizosphaerae]|uniref:DUF3231 family protein n=1 Tax=Paenibacillus allorhizosphaerae TaxID=2849866 RepID=A0ABM8VQ73_9BACL|nr:DUF3231 family protein [Paenibacillus allorhizosphaerae]CAG7653917.1 hypothetical protein PAECIP111802_05621 [Paenibacillus allorhizosphaerae]